MAKRKEDNIDIFKPHKLTFWQAGLFKTAAVSFGILLGVYFQEYLEPYAPLFWVLFLIPGLYIAFIWTKK